MMLVSSSTDLVSSPFVSGRQSCDFAFPVPGLKTWECLLLSWGWLRLCLFDLAGLVAASEWSNSLPQHLKAFQSYQPHIWVF